MTKNKYRTLDIYNTHTRNIIKMSRRTNIVCLIHCCVYTFCVIRRRRVVSELIFFQISIVQDSYGRPGRRGPSVRRRLLSIQYQFHNIHPYLSLQSFKRTIRVI